MTISCYSVSIVGYDHETPINAPSRGAAKAEHFRTVRECFNTLPFTALRARKIGKPQSSGQFKRNAEYRGLPQLRCGDRVRVGLNNGTIVGHDASANFTVWFDQDAPKYHGMKLHVHPSDLCLTASTKT